MPRIELLWVYVWEDGIGRDARFVFGSVVHLAVWMKMMMMMLYCCFVSSSLVNNCRLLIDSFKRIVILSYSFGMAHSFIIAIFICIVEYLGFSSGDKNVYGWIVKDDKARINQIQEIR